MIYIFDKKQKINKVFTDEDLTAGHLDFKLNTATTFEFSVPANKALPSGSKYVAVPHPLDDSKFVFLRLTERVDKTDTVDYSAYELAYQELQSYGYISDKRPKDADALTLMKTALNGTNWELNKVNVAGKASTSFYYVDHLTAISSVVDLLGGEIVFYVEIQGNTISGRYMDYLARQGEDTSKVFSKGSNLLTVERQTDMSSVYTAILPRGKGVQVSGQDDEETPDGYGRRLNIADVEWKKSNGKPLDKAKGSLILGDPDANKEWGHIDGQYRLLLQNYDDVDNVNVLINSAYKTLKSVNHPQIQYSATVADVGGLSLGDTVLIMHGERNLSYKTRVFEVNYDLLAPDQTEISLGDDLTENSIASQVITLGSSQNILSEQTQWTVAQVGREPLYFGSDYPKHPKIGDIFFKYLPNGDTVVYRWNGTIWEKLVSSNTAAEISDAVDDAIKKAKNYTDELNEKQAEEVQKFQSEANAALSSAAAERTVFSSNAASMASSAATHADSMASSASAYAKTEAASALSSANSALTTAKSDLTELINQEISDRNEAVQTVNSQAQDYANQAKADAIAAAETADGVVRKDFKVTTDALSSTISQNKQDSDGKISTAQSTATQALNGLSTKVSQTDYDKKTSDLSTKVNTVTQTATETKNELANVSKTVDSQSAQINTISNTVDGTTQTISDIQTEQGKQSGSIATLQSRADGFDATVTKVNNLAVGGRNLLLDTSKIVTQQGAGADNVKGNFNAAGGRFKFSNSMNTGLFYNRDPKATYILSYDWSVEGDNPSGQFNPQFTNAPWGFGGIAVKPSETNKSGHSVTKFQTQPSWKDTSAWGISFRQDHLVGKVTITNMKLEIGTIPTDWSPAPEDLSGATAQAQLTADKANLDLSKYKTDADGRITKAQADITATANEVKTKVSQSDFDTKTGDLTTKYGQVKATADSVTTDVANYKKSNDSKVSANTSNITANAKAIALKVSQTDFDSNSKDVNTKIANQQITVDKISNSVTELQAKANAQGQINQLMNTEFTPDMQGWNLTSDSSSNAPYKSGFDKNAQANMVGFNTINSGQSTAAILQQDVLMGQAGGGYISLSWQAWAPTFANYANLWIVFYDSNNQQLDATSRQWTPQKADGTIVDGLWTRQKAEGIAIPVNTTRINISFQVREGINAYLIRPMLVFDTTIGDYVAGNYNNNSRVTALELDINGIHGLVDDPKKGMSATWNLASNGQTLAVQAQKDATTAITTAKGVQTQVTSNDDDIKSLQSTMTQTAKQITTEVADRKSGDSAVTTQLTNLIDSRVSSVTSGYQSAISQSANAIMASVSTPNQLLNTEFNPDLEGWSITNYNGTTRPYRSYIDNAIGSVSIGFSTVGDAIKTTGSRIEQTISLASSGTGNKLSMRWDVRTIQNDNYTNLWLVFLDGNGQGINQSINHQWSGPVDNAWHEMKWENVQVPDNARQVRVSFQVRENTRQYLSRPMLVFGATIGSYLPGSYSSMNTSTVLELFKDNWALGIADNAGRLISGINGDKSGTVIQGKKLVINSDTTINGKAFIDGSVIKNASIGTAQIGKAAVGSAQIINVDVSKISGNIANFITANVNTLNAKVLYGDTGHLGTTDTGRVINKQDNHLQLASKGMYNSANDRAQVELLSHTNDIDANMRGSFNYYSDVRKGHGLGIRLVQNQILAIDEDGGSKNLYLSPYAGGQVRIVSRDLNSYYDIAAANFRVSSQRKFKSDIKPLDDGALDIVNKTNIKSYTKNGVSEIGVIADEAPNELISDDGKFINIYDYTSVLYKAVQELSAQVKELQNERPNN